MRTAIDSPPCLPGETRCKHEMLIFGTTHTCAWCKGIALDVPIDFSLGAEVPDLTAFFALPDTLSPLRFVTTDRPEECVRCAERTTVLAWSVEYAGSICKSCAA